MRVSFQCEWRYLILVSGAMCTYRYVYQRGNTPLQPPRDRAVDHDSASNAAGPTFTKAVQGQVQRVYSWAGQGSSVAESEASDG